jgi:hypothetical protein
MSLVLVLLLLGISTSDLFTGQHDVGPAATGENTALVLHTYEARIRLNGKVSTTQIKASDAGQAKKLVQAQFGPSVTVLSVKKVD